MTELQRWTLPVWFTVGTALVAAKVTLAHSALGGDAILYAQAAQAWLSGGDPWNLPGATIQFAGPPPTLVLFVAFAWLPAPVTATFWVVAGITGAVYAVRRLGLAWWWLLFPPFLDGIWVGNPDSVVLGLLMAGGPLADSAAVFLKIYAVAPLVGERRWSSLICAFAPGLLSVAVLPWGRFIAEWGTVEATLARQTSNFNAASVPMLWPLAAVAVLSLGWRRAGWLAVPILSPGQLHYAVLALPAITPLVAAAIPVTVPGASGLAVIGQALWERRSGVRPRVRAGLRRREGRHATSGES